MIQKLAQVVSELAVRTSRLQLRASSFLLSTQAMPIIAPDGKNTGGECNTVLDTGQYEEDEPGTLKDGNDIEGLCLTLLNIDEYEDTLGVVKVVTHIPSIKRKPRVMRVGALAALTNSEKSLVRAHFFATWGAGAKRDLISTTIPAIRKHPHFAIVMNSVFSYIQEIVPPEELQKRAAAAYTQKTGKEKNWQEIKITGLLKQAADYIFKDCIHISKKRARCKDSVEQAGAAEP